jgi:hypothetical protein
VTNNIGDAALVYQNNTNQVQQQTSYTSLVIRDAPANKFAIGARVLLYSKDKVRSYEQQPVHGFQSSMLTALHIGLAHEPVDSAILIWPDQGYQRITLHPNKQDTIRYQTGLRRFDFKRLSVMPSADLPQLKDITAETGFTYRHEENIFNEFNREPLMPAMVSAEGPALAVADINHDGLEDIFAGASKGFSAAVYLQTPAGRFQRLAQPALQLDSMWEHVDAAWVDINKDTHPDLLIATGGNEFYENDEHQQPLLYLNDGKGRLTKAMNAFPNVYGTFSKLAVHDINKDGYPDIFLAGRAEPWKYGVSPRSYLLLNNQRTGFTDATASYSKDLLYPGMITDAHWVDLDQNGENDLLLSMEWGGIDLYLSNGKSFKKHSLTNLHGWWQTCTPADVDGDGDLDIVAANFGLNSRLKASAKEPVKLYVNDFDDNGSAEQIMTYFLKGEEICFSSKTQLEKRMPVLKKKFLYAADFAKASVEDIFGQKKLSSAQQLYADHFAHTVFMNQGKLSFTPLVLPDAAQYATLKAVMPIPSAKPIMLLAGNFYEYNVEIGRMDADQGSFLQMKGGKPMIQQLPGLAFGGQVRKVQAIAIKGKQAYILAKNNDTWQIVQQ